MSGATDPIGAARIALRDAMAALGPIAEAVVLVGAHAIYLHAGDVLIAIAPFTRDADLVVDPRRLADDPRLEDAMRAAGFSDDLASAQPGAWVSPSGIPVDLMVAEGQSGGGGRRGARIPPHSSRAAGRTAGMEAAVVDNRVMTITCPDGGTFEMRVAGPAALLVTKLHKIAERIDTGRRMADKDAHDVHRLLRAVSTADAVDGFLRLLEDELSRPSTERALGHLEVHFGAGPDAPGSVMAGRVEEGVGDPDQVSAAVSFLAADVIRAVAERR